MINDSVMLIFEQRVQNAIQHVSHKAKLHHPENRNIIIPRSQKGSLHPGLIFIQLYTPKMWLQRDVTLSIIFLDLYSRDNSFPFLQLDQSPCRAPNWIRCRLLI